MKKPFIISSLVLTFNSFSFYPMKKIYEDPNYSEPNSPIFLESQVKDKDKDISHCFLYDKHTHNQILNRISLSKERQYHRNEEEQNPAFYKQNALKFLKADFSYDHNFLVDENLEIYNQGYNISPYAFRKQELIFNPDNTIKKTSKLEEKEYKNLLMPFYLRSTFKSQSEVNCITIQNLLDKVTLTQGGKSIDLTTALRNYFVERVKPKEFGDTIAQSYNRLDQSSSKRLVQPMLSRMQSISLEKKYYDLLQKSEILALWGLFNNPKDETIQSQLIGLARDKSGKLFHWTTDLKADISILMQYAPENKKDSSQKEK